MQPLELDSTHFVAKSPDPKKYPNLPFNRDAAADHMTSMWIPTDEELEDLIKGGCVAIRVGGGQPLPMSVTTGMLNATELKAVNDIKEAEWEAKHGTPKKDADIEHS